MECLPYLSVSTEPDGDSVAVGACIKLLDPTFSSPGNAPSWHCVAQFYHVPNTHSDQHYAQYRSCAKMEAGNS